MPTFPLSWIPGPKPTNFRPEANRCCCQTTSGPKPTAAAAQLLPARSPPLLLPNYFRLESPRPVANGTKPTTRLNFALKAGAGFEKGLPHHRVSNAEGEVQGGLPARVRQVDDILALQVTLLRPPPCLSPSYVVFPGRRRRGRLSFCRCRCYRGRRSCCHPSSLMGLAADGPKPTTLCSATLRHKAR